MPLLSAGSHPSHFYLFQHWQISIKFRLCDGGSERLFHSDPHDLTHPQGKVTLTGSSADSQLTWDDGPTTPPTPLVQSCWFWFVFFPRYNTDTFHAKNRSPCCFYSKKKKTRSAGVAGFTSSLASWVCSCTSHVSQSIEAGIKHDLLKTWMWNNTFCIFKRRNKMLRFSCRRYTSTLHLLATLVRFTDLFLFLYFRLISIYLPHKYLFY